MRAVRLQHAFTAAACGLFAAGASLAASPDPALDPPNLRFDAGYTSRLRWDPPAAAAPIFGVYRGTIGAAGLRAYDHACELTENGYRTTRDEDVPPPGEAFYYLVTGLATDAGGTMKVGTLGKDHRGNARPDSATITCGPRVHVDPALATSGDGSDWAQAYRTLGEAVRHAAGADRGLEVWVRGTLTEGPVRYDGAAHPSLSILGGFAGTELRPWQRQPAVTPSGGVTLTVPASARSVRLDGLTDARVTHEGPQASLIVLREARGASGITVSPAFLTASSGTVLVEDGVLDGGTVSLEHFAGTIRLAVRRNVFHTGGIILEAEGAATSPLILATITGNRFEPGAIHARVVGSGTWWGSGTIDSRIESNVFVGGSGSAISLHAEVFAVEGGDVHNDALIVGNTFVDVGGSAVATSALAWSESWWLASASPTLWDNVIVGCGRAALSEGTPYSPSHVTDITTIGSVFHQNAVLLLDEGTDEIATEDALNALPGARDNFALDPLFADATAGDYRLQAGSPCLDRGHRDRPRGTVVDADGRPRFADADGNGIAEPDVGAFEYHPE